MKLKRCIASATAVALAASLVSITPLTASAASTDPASVGFEAFGKSGSDWNQAAFVSNSSAEMAGADLTGLTKIKFIASANFLNSGWSNGQFYVNTNSDEGGSGWKNVSYGGENSGGTLKGPGVFNETIEFNVGTDGFWEAGWGTSSGNEAFGLYGIEFYAGSKKLGTWSDGKFYDASYDLLMPTEYGSSDGSTWTQGDFVNSSSPEMADADMSALTSVKVYAEMRDTGWGWSNGQFYGDGDSWNTVSYGAASAGGDVKLSSVGEFVATLDITPKSDGSWGVGAGTSSSKGVFAVDYIDFFAGSDKLGTWADGIWFSSDIPATAVDVTPATSSIKMGENVQLTAVKTPSNATSTVIWTSSDDKIATVDSKGLVTGVNEGTATITAAVSDTVKATATVEVLTNKTIITPVVDLPDSLTVYTTDTDAQAKLVKAAAKITGIDKLASADYTVTAVSDGSKGTVTFALTTSGAVKYKVSDAAVVSDSCVINFEAWEPTFYDDYTVSGPMTIDVDYNSDASAVSSAITAAIGSQTITMELIASEADHAPLPVKAIEDVMTSIVLPDSYNADSTVSVPVTIGLSNVMNEGDVYYPNYTLGASGEAASTVTVTYTVNIGPDSSKPEPTPDPNPNPNPDPNPNPNPTPDPEPTPDPVPTGYNGDGTDPTAKYPSNGSTDCAASRFAGGNAFSSARAGYAIRQAASGSEVVIIMESDDIIPRRVLELLAQKDNVNATFVYSGYSVTINSDDIDADEVTDIDLSNKGKFLTADELAMFDGAIEVRQLNISAFKGIAKVQITMTMTGASKGADGTALDRTSEGQFRFISDGSVGDDRTFSFEITEGGKYVVYTGDCDVEVYEDDV